MSLAELLSLGKRAAESKEEEVAAAAPPPQPAPAAAPSTVANPVPASQWNPDELKLVQDLSEKQGKEEAERREKEEQDQKKRALEEAAEKAANLAKRIKAASQAAVPSDFITGGRSDLAPGVFVSDLVHGRSKPAGAKSSWEVSNSRPSVYMSEQNQMPPGKGGYRPVGMNSHRNDEMWDWRDDQTFGGGAPDWALPPAPPQVPQGWAGDWQGDMDRGYGGPGPDRYGPGPGPGPDRYGGPGPDRYGGPGPDRYGGPCPDRGYGGPERGYGGPERGYGGPERGYGGPGRGYDGPDDWERGGPCGPRGEWDLPSRQTAGWGRPGAMGSGPPSHGGGGDYWDGPDYGPGPRREDDWRMGKGGGGGWGGGGCGGGCGGGYDRGPPTPPPDPAWLRGGGGFPEERGCWGGKGGGGYGW